MVVAFGNLFNEIKLARYDTNGKELESFLVPIVYGGKEKYVSRLEGDPNLDKKVQVSLPIMSFELVNMNYDSARKLNTNFKNTVASGTTALAVYNPVPFDFEFQLFVYVRNIEDGAQIVEKILPFFTPDYTVSVNLIPEMNVVKQLPILLKDISQDIDYEGEYDSKVRTVIWTLNFTIKGYLYGQVSQPKIIRNSITNIIDDNSLSGSPVTTLMNSGGTGNYKVGEKIYQGYSYDMATATGTVYSWNSGSNTLVFTDSTGHFVSNTSVIGLDSNATWVANTFSISNYPTVRVDVKPNPLNVVLPNNYTYTVTVEEAPNITN
jgi:hypothetical protein